MSGTTNDPRAIPAAAALVPAAEMRHHTLHWVWRDNSFTVWTWSGSGWLWVDLSLPEGEQINGYSVPSVAYAEGWRYLCPAVPPTVAVPR